VRTLADQHAGQFQSSGMTTLFGTLQRELSDDYLASVQDYLAVLKFRYGVRVSAMLGRRNEGINYMLRPPRAERSTWLQRIFGKAPQAFEFRIHERDEAGMRALSELRDRGINGVANAAAQSADHLLSFFVMLCAELAFYVCGLNLRDTLAAMGAPVSIPVTAPMGTRALTCSGLYDVCLALSLGQKPVENSVDADGRSLVIITGANQGGKSSFLRAVGLAQLMMQCGMFVGAHAFRSDLCTGLFTHYKREEDATMQRGKFDEELARLSEIADVITPGAMLLLNESFAATDEREGSEVAKQIVTALLEQGVRICFVTHLYEFAHGIFAAQRRDVLFLRAERLPNGRRTFRLVTGEPLTTSYGEDLYREIFAVSSGSE
jgi:DNA mismatch repair ATPase MutS